MLYKHRRAWKDRSTLPTDGPVNSTNPASEFTPENRPFWGSLLRGNDHMPLASICKGETVTFTRSVFFGDFWCFLPAPARVAEITPIESIRTSMKNVTTCGRVLMLSGISMNSMISLVVLARDLTRPAPEQKVQVAMRKPHFLFSPSIRKVGVSFSLNILCNKKKQTVFFFRGFLKKTCFFLGTLKNHGIWKLFFFEIQKNPAPYTSQPLYFAGSSDSKSSPSPTYPRHPPLLQVNESEVNVTLQVDPFWCNLTGGRLNGT